MRAVAHLEHLLAVLVDQHGPHVKQLVLHTQADHRADPMTRQSQVEDGGVSSHLQHLSELWGKQSWHGVKVKSCNDCKSSLKQSAGKKKAKEDRNKLFLKLARKKTVVL